MLTLNFLRTYRPYLQICCFSQSKFRSDDPKNKVKTDEKNDEAEKKNDEAEKKKDVVFIKRDSPGDISSIEEKIRNRLKKSSISNFKYGKINSRDQYVQRKAPNTLKEAADNLSMTLSKNKKEASLISKELLNFNIKKRFGATPALTEKDIELSSFEIRFDDLEAKENVASCNPTFEMIEAHHFRSRTNLPATNQFDEWIQWTRDGKLWHFPIDNEQGMDEEKLVGFEEHVFIEWRCPELPETGPIAHFMELVATGLSKNPYLTVQEKRAHIEWLTMYLKDKVKIVEESVKETKRQLELEEEERKKVLLDA